MKEKVALGIASMFALAWVILFAIGKIPVEVFASVVTGALVWIFKDVEHQRNLKKLLKEYDERIAKEGIT
jgi:hypothetical protein